jgi:hypothetical protein
MRSGVGVPCLVIHCRMLSTNYLRSCRAYAKG